MYMIYLSIYIYMCVCNMYIVGVLWVYVICILSMCNIYVNNVSV